MRALILSLLGYTLMAGCAETPEGASDASTDGLDATATGRDAQFGRDGGEVPGADIGVTADGGEVADAYAAGTAVFDDAELHRIEIEVATGDLQQLDQDTTSRVPCTITFDGVEIANAGVRKKGMSTLAPLSGKPSFSVKLNEFVPGRELDGLKKIVLNNSARDPTLMNEHLTYELYRRAGQPAPRTSHAVVTFNGETKGFYVVKEAVAKQFLARWFGSSNDDGNLYEGPWDFTKGAAAADLKDEVEEMRTRDDLEALTDVVMNASDAELIAAAEPLIDLDQFISSFAVDMAFNVWDGYAIVAWNFYLYDHPADHRFVFIPHGADWPFWHADFDPLDLHTYPWGPNDPPGYLAERVRQIPELDARFQLELRRVIMEAYDVDALNAVMDQAARVVRTAPGDDPMLAVELDAFEASVGEAYDFVRERKAYLDALP